MKKQLVLFGASGAVGSAVAKQAVASGWDVVGLGRQAPTLDGVEGLALDIQDAAAIEERFAEWSRPVDAVVFAQGYQPAHNLETTSATHIRTMLDVHVTGTLLALKALRPHVQVGAAVVLMSSIAATKGSYDASYAAAKGATSSMVRSLAREWFGLARVNAVAPGLIADSPVHQSMAPEHAAKHSERMFGNELVRPEQVAAAIAHLMENTALNGAVLAVDGGYV